MRFLFPGANLSVENFMMKLGSAYNTRTTRLRGAPALLSRRGTACRARPLACQSTFPIPNGGSAPFLCTLSEAKGSKNLPSADSKNEDVNSAMTPADRRHHLVFRLSLARPAPLAVRTIHRVERHRPLLWLPIIGTEPALRNKGYGQPESSDRGPFPIREMACRLPILIDTTDD